MHRYGLLVFCSLVILMVQGVNKAVAAEQAKEVPIPQSISAELKAALAQYPSPSVEEARSFVPTTAEQWRDYVQATNKMQKTKIKNMRKHYGVTVEMLDIKGVTVRKITPKSLSPEFKDHVYIDIHGGAYVLFAGLPSIEEGILIAHRLGIVVYSVDYRMPPAYPFPAALDDVKHVYRVLSQQYDANHIFMGGTSAGGGLLLAFVQGLIENGLATPRAIYAGTPWADLTKTGDSLYTNEGIDRILITYDGTLGASARLYAGNTPLTHPKLSPIYGDFTDFPPTFLVTGTRDMFLSDTVRVNRKMRDAGVTTVLDVYEGLSHADYLVSHQTPESQSVYRQLKRFLVGFTQ